MPILEERWTDRPESYITRDYTTQGNVRAVLGFRIINNEGEPVRCRITYNDAVVEWWTMVTPTRSDEIIEPGETVSATFNLAIGQATKYSLSLGPA